jgi:Mrp family chromosome partitioning ATPase
MSQWFDVLYRRQARDKNVAIGALAAEPDDVSEETPSEKKARRSEGVKARLQRVAPIAGIPNRWSLEVQRIVFHLRPVVDDPEAPRNIVFSGVQGGPGVSTICYLVAHYLATEGYDQRVLYVNFDPSASAPQMTSADATLRIGDTLQEDAPYLNNNSTLTTVAIRGDSKQAVSTASGWLYEFMASATEHFDWILVDSPPFFVSPETYSVAKVCDGVVLVLKSGETRYPALKALVADLDSLGINIIGTVLNFRQYPLPRWLLRYV